MADEDISDIQNIMYAIVYELLQSLGLGDEHIIFSPNYQLLSITVKYMLLWSLDAYFSFAMHHILIAISTGEASRNFSSCH